jgi:hypothetical protein
VRFWLSAAAFALLAVAAVSVWYAFQQPEFVLGLSGLAALAAWNAFAPIIFKRMLPKDEAAWRQRQREAKTGRQDNR